MKLLHSLLDEVLIVGLLVVAAASISRAEEDPPSPEIPKSSLGTRPANADELERRAKQNRSTPFPAPFDRAMKEERERFARAPMPSKSERPPLPSPLHRFWQGTKNFFARTGRALTPTKARNTGPTPGYNVSNSRKKSTSWWGRKSEPQPSKTLSGFFEQDRPK